MFYLCNKQVFVQFDFPRESPGVVNIFTITWWGDKFKNLVQEASVDLKCHL